MSNLGDLSIEELSQINTELLRRGDPLADQ